MNVYLLGIGGNSGKSRGPADATRWPLSELYQRTASSHGCLTSRTPEYSRLSGQEVQIAIRWPPHRCNIAETPAKRIEPSLANSVGFDASLHAAKRKASLAAVL